MFGPRHIDRHGLYMQCGKNLQAYPKRRCNTIQPCCCKYTYPIQPDPQLHTCSEQPSENVLCPALAQGPDLTCSGCQKLVSWQVLFTATLLHHCVSASCASVPEGSGSLVGWICVKLQIYFVCDICISGMLLLLGYSLFSKAFK